LLLPLQTKVFESKRHFFASNLRKSQKNVIITSTPVSICFRVLVKKFALSFVDKTDAKAPFLKNTRAKERSFYEISCSVLQRVMYAPKMATNQSTFFWSIGAQVF
jgi:hypothetical protein